MKRIQCAYSPICIYIYIYILVIYRDIHIVTNSFALLLRGDLQAIQHITGKDLLDDNMFYRVTFSNQLGISNFDLISSIILK